MPRSAIKKRPAQGAVLLKHAMAILAVLIIAGCSGGGCGGGGCSSCGGVTPLQNGFDVSHRVENAGSVRLTQSGLTFLQQNLGPLAKQLVGGSSMGGTLTFEIPASSGSTTGIDYTVCPGGADPNANPPKCTAEIDIGAANLAITPAAPRNIKITGTIPLRLQNLPLHVKGLCVFGFCAIDTDVTGSLNGDGACPGGGYDNVPVDVDIEIYADQVAAHTGRFGYSRVEVKNVVNKGDLDNNLGDNLHFCGGFLGSILDLVKGLLVGQLSAPLVDTLKTQIDDALCQKATPEVACPQPSVADGSGVCRYADNTCASTILGTDGHMDLGGFLASVSPGTKGGLDFLFAAGGSGKNTSTKVPAGANLSWGDLAPVAGGATLGMFGGAEPSPISKCVKLSNMPMPTGIPIPNELFENTVQGWPAGTPGPHVGIALSERFTNYALSGMYNSGLLCIGISTESIAQLSSGTLGLLAPSAKDLGLQHEAQQVALVIRPSAPPSVAFGNGTDPMMDPTMRVTMKGMSIDFYIYSLDRFIRFMTATFDLDVPVTLSVGPEGLTPMIPTIGVSNGKVTNSSLLREKPDALATAIGSLIGSLVGAQLGSAINPIDLSGALSSVGLTLDIPNGGMRKLSLGSDNFLGIFASLGVAPAGPIPPPGPNALVHPASRAKLVATTEVQVTKKSVDPKGLKWKTLTADNKPVVELLATSSIDDGSRAVEYAYKVDTGFWHPWTRSRFITVKDDWMRVQGRHVIYVKSRAADDPMSADTSPAQAEVVIDADPPAIRVNEVEEGKVAIDVSDLGTDDALVRYRLDDGAWSTWRLASRVGAIDVSHAQEISVEAKDTEGNVGTAKQALVRGRADAATAAAGCGCTVVGSDDRAPSHAIWVLGVALAGIGARLFRRGRGSKDASPQRASRAGQISGKRAAQAAAMMAVASTWAGCTCGEVDTTGHGGSKPTSSSTTSSETTSGTGGTATSTIVSLSPGLIGEYASVAVSGSDIWVSGYSEADWDNGYPYGDLVVGKWDGAKVAWTQVDGVPTEPAPDATVYDLKGFRGGQTEPGDDVGLWSSIAIGADGNPGVAYYDRTHKALKFALFDGTTWATHTVESKPSSDIGRYAKVLVVGGSFVVAYQSIEPGGKNGALLAKVRVATASKPAAGAWTFEDVATSDTTPCTPALCASGSVCVKSTLACTATTPGCSPACASGKACVANACADIIDSTKIYAYPDAIGGYVSAAADGKGGFGIAYYDRPKGNLMTAAKVNGKWKTLLVDGADAMGNDTGDVGIGTSLFIDDAGDWHITYVNGFTEAVQYVKVAKGATVGTPEIVDDGLGLSGTPFDDGQHLVGDDSHIHVLAGGAVHVTYQDATAGTLHYAVGMPSATGHTWTVKKIQQEGFAGAFSHVLVVGGQLQLANWWRQGGNVVTGDVRIMQPK